MTSRRRKRGDEVANLAQSLDAFHRRFAPLFGRIESQRLSAHYLQRLLTGSAHRPYAGAATTDRSTSARAMQRFLSAAPWPTEPVIDAVQRELGQRLNAPDGTFVVGEIGFRKQGDKSAGVARQACVGHDRIANCQLGVFLAYVSSRGQALLDARLYLPEQWAADEARRRAVGVPAGLIYQSRHELALDLLRRVRAWGHLTGNAVTVTGWFGAPPTLRDTLDTDGWHYIVGVPATTRVRSKRRQRANAPAATNRTSPLAPHLERSAHMLGATLAADGWHQLTVELGRQGRWPFHFAVQAVLEERPDRPGTDSWLIVRRDLDGRHPHYYLSNAPVDSPLVTLAQLARYGESAAALFNPETGAVGLGDYEVRSWAGWHHHIALTLLLGAFLLDAKPAIHAGGS